MQYFSFWERNLLDVQILLTVTLILWDVTLTFCACRADLTLTVLSANVFQILQQETAWNVYLTCGKLGVTFGCVQVHLLLIQYMAHCLNHFLVTVICAAWTNVTPSVHVHAIVQACYNSLACVLQLSLELYTHIVMSLLWIANDRTLTVQKVYMVCRTIPRSLHGSFRTLQVSLTAALTLDVTAIQKYLQQLRFFIRRHVIAVYLNCKWLLCLVWSLQVCTLLVLVQYPFQWHHAICVNLLLTVMFAYLVWLTIHWTNVMPSVHVLAIVLACCHSFDCANQLSLDLNTHIEMPLVWIANILSLTVQKVYMVCRTIPCFRHGSFRTLQGSLTDAQTLDGTAIHKCLQQHWLFICRHVITVHLKCNWLLCLVRPLRACTLLVITQYPLQWQNAICVNLLLLVMCAYMVWLTIHWRGDGGWLFLAFLDKWMMASLALARTLHCTQLHRTQWSHWLHCTTMTVDTDMSHVHIFGN